MYTINDNHKIYQMINELYYNKILIKNPIAI